MAGERDIDLDGLSAAAVCDALAAVRTHRAHILDLVSPTPDVALFGRVATMRFFPNRADHHSTADRFDDLLGQIAGSADVLVIGAGGHEDQAVAGGKKVARIEAAGFTGLLTDARLRDLDEIAGFDISCWCSGETIRASGDDSMPLETNVPVEIDRVGVLPGDWVYADTAGAVVIPDVDLEAVIAAAHEIEARDAAAVTAARLRLNQ